MSARKVTLGQHGGITTVMTEDVAGRKVHFQDIMSSGALQNLLDTNAQMRLAGPNKKAPGRLTHMVPITEWINWKDEYKTQAKNVMSWEEFRNRKLHARENQKFATIREGYRLRTGA